MKNRIAALVGVAVLSGCAVAALGQSSGSVPQLTTRSTYLVAAPNPIVVFSNSTRRLRGRGGTGADRSAARVEIRARKWGSDIVPPAADGSGDDIANPIVLTTRIGAGVMEEAPGRFVVPLPTNAIAKFVATSASSSSSDYRGFFVRVYDAPTVEESAYYVDSDLIGYDPDLFFTNVTFSSAMKAINPPAGGAVADYDGDGISDDDEALLGTDYQNPDSDGDGLSDFDEVYFGLDPTDPHPPSIQLSANRNQPEINAILPTNSSWHVEWKASTEPTVSYTIEFVPDVGIWTDGSGEIHSISVDRTITQTNWAEDITPWMTNRPRGFFRLRMDLDRTGLDAKPEETENGGETPAGE